MKIFALALAAVVVVAAVVLVSGVVSAAAGRATPADYLITSLPDMPLLSKNYAGSLNLTDDGTETAFFWFVESESDPKTDPVVQFMSGGPGCSSLIAFSTEMGPVQMRHGGQFVVNPWRWTAKASMLFIESPGGVGFSQSQTRAWSDNNTAVYNLKALNKFFEIFADFSTQPYTLTGESYAGRYVPTLANAIFEENGRLRKRMRGAMAGNPCTSGKIGCQLSDPTLKSLLVANGFVPYAEDVAPESARYDPYDLLVPTCDNDHAYTMTQWMEGSHPVIAAYGRRMRREGRHPDQRKALRDPPAAYGPCALDYVTAYLNRADVKQFIHAPRSIVWNACANVNYDITKVSMMPLWEKFSKETDWHLMLYSGLSDAIVNHQQTEWAIKHESNFALAKKAYIPWYRPNVWNASQTEHAGFYLQYEGRFQFCGVKDAGHMVPQYNPPSAGELFRSFMETGGCGRLAN